MTGFGTSPLELMATDAMLRGEIYCESFDYTFIWTDGNGNGLDGTDSEDSQLQIDSSSDFIFTEMNLIAATAVDTFIGDPDLTLALVVAGSGRQIMNRPTHVANITGTYRTPTAFSPFPARMVFPRLIPKNSTFTATLTNRGADDFSGAGGLVQLTLRGFKVFYTGGNADQLRQQIFHIL